ncbi:DUF3429 domain-containing protein [Chelatococcus sambhunathii]|uniref:DUF3429 domain-containing protein n=1 Tax=Chelatococcus sambhunathii TaxID=363953 RepID=A0ABU1DF73_9HYPH|nr:DUF3429 domain-containing protein [Chelatococcus sambhunathii]MDR4306766.1 DUF3429 domain-containing protein [Chelatococcus sambhunathii]
MTLIASEPIRDDAEIPALPLWLGLLGLIPFIGLALAIALHGRDLFGLDAAAALLGYGATILSFLGGAHWGLALRHPNAETRRGLSVGAMAPPLWAWGALLVGGASGLFMLGAGLAAHGIVDGLWSTRFAAPRWYGRLRLLLAALATIATVAAGAVIASQQIWVS